MSLQIRQRISQHLAFRLALLVLGACLLAGLLLRLFSGTTGETQTNSSERPEVPPGIHAAATLMVPVIHLRISDPGHESSWVAAFAKTTGGESEVTVSSGRVDVLLENYAIEVDFSGKWKEGLGQALSYGDATGKIPCLALIEGSKLGERQLASIERLCLKQGVRLVLLERATLTD